MTEASVKLPELEKQVFAIDNKQDMFRLMANRVDLLGGRVTLSQLATVDSHYTTTTGKTEWENVRLGRAGYTPTRRATMAMGQLINLKHLATCSQS